MDTEIHSAPVDLLKGHTIKLTKKRVLEYTARQLPEGKAQVEITDAECSALKLVVYSSGKATFYSRFHWKYRRCSKRIGSFPEISVEQARRDATAHKLSVENGSSKPNQLDQSITFCEAIKEYLSHARSTKKSHRSDESKIKNHLIPFFRERIRLSDISKEDIQSYLNKLRGKGLSDSTCDRHVALLKAAEKFFLQKGWLHTSFMTSIKMVNPKNGRVRYLSAEELGRFVAACREHEGDAYRCFELLAALGLRISEGLSLRFEDWDRQSQTLFLPDSKTGSRHVMLNPNATSILEAQAKKYGATGLIFRGKHPETPMSRPARAWMRILKHARLNDNTVTPHTLRHSFCAQLLMAGVDEYTVAKLMGLSSTHCIHRHYGHLSNHALLNACRKASDIINSAIGEHDGEQSATA